MNFRKMFFFAIAALLCWGRPAFPQVNGVEVGAGATAQVFGGKSPVVKVADAEGQELASIPIEKDPGRFIYSESANTLYVVHNEKKLEHFISVVNLTTRQVDKEIKVGAGAEVDLFLSNGGHRLFCYTAGKLRGPVNREKWLNPPFEPAISLIDTTSNEVIATYNWLDSFRATLQKRWFFSSQFIAATDGGVLVVRSEAISIFGGKPIPNGDKFIVFSGSSSHPASMIDANGQVVGSILSKDEKLLFVAIEGDKKNDGALVVVNLEKGTTVTHALTDHPTRLFRLGSRQEPWVLGDQEMRSLSETGEPGDRRIPLNKPSKSEAGSETGASAFLDGFPGETITFGDDHAAMLINDKNGGSRHKVALLDLKKLQVDSIIPTMSTGEIAGIRTKRYLGALGLSLATGGNPAFIPNWWTIRNEALAARPDGRFLFALDLEGHEVTVIDVQTSTVVRRISVDRSITKLKVSSDGKHLICFGRKTQQINLESNNLED